MPKVSKRAMCDFTATAAPIVIPLIDIPRLRFTGCLRSNLDMMDKMDQDRDIKHHSRNRKNNLARRRGGAEKMQIPILSILFILSKDLLELPLSSWIRSCK